VRIALAQINPTIGDFRGNTAKVLDAVRRGAREGAQLVVLPELSLCGYPPMDLLDQPTFVEENLAALRAVQHGCPAGVSVVVGYVDLNRTHAGKRLRNVASILRDGRILFTQAKTLLPTYDVFDEARYFEPAAERAVYVLDGIRIGIAICEDFWWESEREANTRNPVDPVKDLLDLGASLIVAPSASPYYAGKPRVRLGLLSGIGKTSGVPVVYVNMVGGNDNLIFDGASLVTSPTGELALECAAFREDLRVVDTGHLPASQPLVEDTDRELEQALVLGTRDYLAKTGFQRVHLGLSGGIDSALVAVLATKAVGPENVRLFSLPSRYSSEGSKTDAAELARRLGVRLDTLPIEEIFTASLDALECLFRGTQPGLAEENLQARIRGMLLMAHSNKHHSILLATGNKSELATGYCTLYGDMNGALAVIGDLLKTEVYRLARAINARDGNLIPEPILAKPPSAELAPNQTDQDTLPPYDLLDEILTLYVLENMTAPQIVERGYEEPLVRRVLTMVGRAEYKRRQAPPVLKVSRRAFGTGRRLPIARVIHEA
jgi:NAD+ synthase (glutamine-hydrolysing)